jgi:hypothetical protein
MHDDQLFVRLGHYLAAGQWLGPYDNLTLAKGIFYPMFIAAAFWASIPLKIAEHAFYLAVCALTARVVWRRTGNKLSLLLFTFLAFNPVLWNYALARALRQGIYLSLALLVVTLLVVILFPPPPRFRSRSRGIILPIGLGLATVAYWTTREEGAWLVPVAGVVLLLALREIFFPARVVAAEMEPRSSQVKAIAVPLVIAIMVFTAADWSVAALNYRYYGLFETNEFRARNFLRAYGAISRIQQDHWRHAVPFPKDARQRAYQVSPAARELAPWLEGSTYNRWVQITCTYSGTANVPCDEVQAGFAMWEFRDAVADAGHYKSGADAMRFYGELADQIDAACDSGKIACLPPRATMQPPFRPEYLRLAWDDAKPITRLTFSMVEGPVVPMPSAGSVDEVAIFADSVDEIYLPERNTYVVRGWVASAAGVPAIKVESRNNDSSETSVAPGPAPDVEKVYPALKSVRFELKTNCPAASCDLVFNVPGQAPQRFPLASVLHKGPIPPNGQTPGLMGYVELASGTDAFVMRDRRRELQMKIANNIAPAYAYLFPRLGAVAAIGLLLAASFRRKFPLPPVLLALGLGSAVAVATYIALMSYLKATADMNIGIVAYLSSASPFVITFTLIGLYSYYVALKTWSLGDRMRSDRVN